MLHVANSLKPIRIVTVDDHPVLREGLAAMIGSQADFTLVAEAETGRQALALFAAHRPDILLLDLRLPDMNGLEVLRAIMAAYPDARVIVLTTYLGDIPAVRALRAGAAGYLLKATLRRDLIDTIREVHGGGRKIPLEVTAELARHAGDDVLTEREVEVLRLIAAGCSNKSVAQKLSIVEDTVKGHVRNILAKLGANDRTHAVTIGLKRGYFDL